MILPLVVVAVVWASVEGCSRSSGGCGCGCGGGCRARARSSLRLEGDNAVDADFGEIYGLSHWESKKANVPVEQITDPSYLFKTCCAERNLPAACQARCTFTGYTQELLQQMMLGHDDCPLDSLSEMHFCAAQALPSSSSPHSTFQGRNHTGCCRKRGVTAVEAGELCLAFCDQTPDKYTPIDYNYVSCFERFNHIKSCFYDEVKDKAEQYFGH